MYFAMMYPIEIFGLMKRYKICILKIKDGNILDMMKDLKSNNYYCEFNSDVLENKVNLQFINKLRFDR